jgi:hypothetical protein
VTGATFCWTGEDCSTKDNDPRDFGGHGTHCAGIVSAINNNNRGVCSPGGGWNPGTESEFGNGVKIMACRVGYSMNDGGEEVGVVRTDFCAEGFYYAADNGANIASCSWGSSNTGGLGAAVTYFINHGGLVFSAAGNDDNETASYLCNRSDVVSVAATDEDDCKASFSSYGTWVDVSAPGVSIRSTYHVHDAPETDYYADASGTSMACPLAAGVAALIWSKHPGWTASQIRSQLEYSTDDIDGIGCNIPYAGKLGTGRINALKALSCCQVIPSAIDFGYPYVGDHVDATFMIINVGCANISGTASEACSHYSIISGGEAYSLSPGDTHFVTIRYQPTSAGTHNCTIDSGTPDCNDVACTGTAFLRPCEVYPDSLDFGTVLLGHHATLGFYIKNNGSISITGDVTSPCEEFEVWDGTPYYIFPGDSQLVTVRYYPSSAGRDTCWIDTGRAACSDVFCEGIGMAPAACQVDPDTLLFIGGYLDSTFTITNTGGDTLRGEVSETCNHFSIISGAGSYSLTAGQSHDVTVRFQPTSTGQQQCTVETGEDLCADVFCAGIGVQPADCLVQPDTLDFGTVAVDDSLDLTFIVTNTGGDTLRGAVSESCDPFTIISGGGPFALAASETLLVGVRFIPPDKVVYNCTIDIGDTLCANVFCTGEGDPMSDSGGTVPLRFALEQNHPNPFNPTTTISFTLPEKLKAELVVFNLSGQRIRTLLNELQPAGPNQVVWNGRDDHGIPVSSGVYFYRLKAGRYMQTRKMVLLK